MLNGTHNEFHSLTDFQANPNEHFNRIKATGEHLVLTINDEAEFVVVNAASYDEMLKALDRLEAIEGIQRGLEEVRQGKTRPARQALQELRAELNLPQTG